MVNHAEAAVTCPDDVRLRIELILKREYNQGRAGLYPTPDQDKVYGCVAKYLAGVLVDELRLTMREQ